MEKSTDELQEVGGASPEVKNDGVELMQETTQHELKGASNVVMEAASGGDTLQNGHRGGAIGGGAIGGGAIAGGGEDLSSINAMMSAVMSATGTINGGDAEGGSAVTSANSSAGPSPSPSPSKSLAAMRAPPSRNVRRNQDAKDDSASYICPLCDKNCQTQHQLTMHIRQHNADTGATDHSCSICGKCLSSASSLDRHMLVHSGERPYKCTICSQTFTTNGNMHRHMKIHEKDPASGLLPISPPSPTKRRRPSVKRRQGPEDENGEEPPCKKGLEDAAAEEATVAVCRSEEELLPCPICFKTCTSRLDLDAHMDSHPDTALRCDFCCLSFRTHRGLLRHNAAVHKLLPQDPSGRPFIQNNPSIPTGFNDLAFIDFSCKKFSHIAQVWCETNLRRCISKFHRFVCDGCDKAFPLRSALDLHKTSQHTSSSQEQEAPEDRQDQEEALATTEQEHFLQVLGLQHVSKVKSGPTDDEIHQAHLDSIKVIHVEPPSSSLPQEPASGFLSGGLGLTLGLGVGMGGLAALSIPLLEASGSPLQSLTQRDTLSLLSLQPFQTGFLLQPDGGGAAPSGVKPGEAGGAGIMELANIQQILKVAAAAPNQLGLPPLAKAPGFPGGQGLIQKSMPPLKPKPPISPCSGLATTPPPLQSSQQASLGCISPSLPPPAPSLFKTPSSSASSSTGNGECPGDTHTSPSDSPPAATTVVQEEAGLSGRKPGLKVGNSNLDSAKGSFPCRFCDQVFAFSGVLQAHMRFHLGILPHQCNICDYVAPDKATLIRHLRTHSGERPYVCRVCHYPFTVKANCERHLRKKHAKTSRKDIEKNIKYVASTVTTAITTPPTGTQDAETARADTTCRFCSEDLKTYRALQIHLRTHNGCQKKPFECRRCGAAFLAKRNCIHHLLKQHPEVQEREIEEHIATLLPAAGRTVPGNSPVPNGLSPPPAAALQAVKVEELSAAGFPADPDQPLDFSAKGRTGSCVPAASPAVKLESMSPTLDCPPLDQPIDLSVPSKRQRRDVDIKMEHQQLTLAPPKDEKMASGPPPLHPHPQLGCYQLPPGSTPPPTSRAPRLKPLLPKPTAASSSPSSALKELPPLASIAQIIHSVSGAPDLLKRDTSLEAKTSPTCNPSHAEADAPRPPNVPESHNEDTVDGASRKKCKKKLTPLPMKEKLVGSSIDLESSGEFASVEKMLATTDANKFSPFLQSAELTAKRDRGGEEKEGGVKEEGKGLTVATVMAVTPPNKGKKNAYSNSVQKMTCPFCPRVFPWASSLQRHMLTHTGQKPFPCPRCDAFFSTKSNCERHLLRKHGVTHRTLRRNGAITKKEGEEGSQESAESQSETEVAADAHEQPGVSPVESGHTYSADGSTHFTSAQASPTHKASPGCSPASETQQGPLEEPEEQQEVETSKHPDQQGVSQAGAATEGKQPPQSNKVDSTDDDDCHSNKSLDLNFGKKLIDFKLSTSSSASAHEEQPTQPAPSSSSSSTPHTESPEKELNKMASSSPSPGQARQAEYKHVCRVCSKNFRYATTLARHERAHLSEEEPAPQPAVPGEVALATEEEDGKESRPTEEEEDEERDAEMEGEDRGMKGGESEAGESGESEEEEGEKEKEERSDEEASEPKSTEGGGASGGRVDKRKKICNVCGKRFWSLQDLTRHTRSHTGERPYQCQTCERTFTLKHSLVRHQRIHLKPRGADGSSAANDDASEDGDSCTPTPTSTCPPSENESECGSAANRAKELEEEGEGPSEEPGHRELSGSDPDPQIAVVLEPAVEEKEGRSQQTDSNASNQATDTKTTNGTDRLAGRPTPADSNTSKDPAQCSASSSSGALPVLAADGSIRGIVEIHAKPPVEHTLPNGERPLMAAD